jgi:uncharacterized membrane protein
MEILILLIVAILFVVFFLFATVFLAAFMLDREFEEIDEEEN